MVLDEVEQLGDTIKKNSQGVDLDGKPDFLVAQMAEP